MQFRVYPAGNFSYTVGALVGALVTQHRVLTHPGETRFQWQKSNHYFSLHDEMNSSTRDASHDAAEKIARNSPPSIWQTNLRRSTSLLTRRSLRNNENDEHDTPTPHHTPLWYVHVYLQNKHEYILPEFKRVILNLRKHWTLENKHGYILPDVKILI